MACREYGRMVLGPARPLERVKERTVTVPGVLSLEGNWTLRCEYRPSPIGGGENDGFFCFDCAKLKGPLRVRGRMSGDELALPGRPRRSLKKILIDRKVPRRRRESIPILADDLGVLAAAGIGPDSRRLARDGAPALWVRFESVPGDRPPKDAERERVMEDA